MKKSHLAPLALALSWALTQAASAQSQQPDDYDRLDGHGASGKTVQVIEWEGNLEIHVMPKGSLQGLALKLDKPAKDKLVMVIGYRFADHPTQQLIRRAILGIPLHEGFHVYRDPSEDEFDKILISNNVLSDQVVAFRLDPEPKQLYPDGHPALAASGKPSGASGDAEKRVPAGTIERPAAGGADEDGTIQPFFMRRGSPLHRN